MATRRAILPDSEKTTSMPGRMSTALLARVDTTASTIPSGAGVCARTKLYAWLALTPISACCATLAMMATAECGQTPLAVSPESMSASAPSKTALATSEISARVG